MNGGSSSKKLRTELGAFIDPVTNVSFGEF